MNRKPQLGNSSTVLTQTLESGVQYRTSAWIRPQRGEMKEKDFANASIIHEKLLEYGLAISMSFQIKDQNGFTDKGSLMIFPNDPHFKSGTFSKIDSNQVTNARSFTIDDLENM